MATESALLAVRRLTVQFGRLTAINDLSLEVQPGEIVGVIGPNGSGKTTLFNCITGLYRATTGSIV
jgi:branched-chain amino acid transport system ATP-binding protein